MSIKGQGHSLTLVKGHSDFKVKCLTFGLYTQVSDSGPHGPLVIIILWDRKKVEKKKNERKLKKEREKERREFIVHILKPDILINHKCVVK